MLFNQDQIDIMTAMRENVKGVNRTLISTVILFLETPEQQKEFLAFIKEPNQNYNSVLDKLEEITDCCGESAMYAERGSAL